MIDPIALLNLTARDSSVRARLTSMYGLTRFWICRTFRTNLPPMFWKALAFSFVFAVSALAQNAKHPFTFEDMMKLKRVDEPVPSPDGKWVVFSATDVDLEANTKISHLWIVPANGGPAEAEKRLSETPNHEERPRFSPDGKRLIWTSKATDPTEIWMCDFNSDGGALVGKPHQVTDISTGADGGIWSPDGKNIVFVSAVYPDCKDDACNKQRDEELKKSKVKAKIFTKLFYRHWNAFTEFKRSHLFVQSVEAGVSPAPTETKQPGTAATTEERNLPRDLTPGDHDVPPFHLGGQDLCAISADGQELAYTSNIDEVEATSTNSEIFTVPLTPASANGQSGSDPKKISTSPGADSTPLYSPDGKYLAWRSQARAGFEADKWRLFVQDRQSGKTRDLTEKFDRSVGSYSWNSTSEFIYFSYESAGQAVLGQASVGRGGLLDPNLLNSSAPTKAELEWPDVHDEHIDNVVVTRDALYYTQNLIAEPDEIWSENLHPDSHGDLRVPRKITHVNEGLLANIDKQGIDDFTFKGANDEKIHGFI